MTENDIRNMIITLLCEKVEHLELELACAKRSKENLEAENKALKEQLGYGNKTFKELIGLE